MNLSGYLITLTISFIIVSLIILLLITLLSTKIETFAVDIMTIDSSKEDDILSNVQPYIYFKFNSGDLSGNFFSPSSISVYNQSKFINNNCSLNTKDYIKGNASLSFGDKSYLQLNTRDYNLNSNNFSIMFFAKIVYKSGISTLLSHTLKNPTMGYIIRINNKNIEVVIGTNKNNNWATVLTYPLWTDKDDTSLAEWYYITLTYDNARNSKWILYINGQEAKKSEGESNKTLYSITNTTIPVIVNGDFADIVPYANMHKLLLGANNNSESTEPVDVGALKTSFQFFKINISGSGVSESPVFINNNDQFYIRFTRGTRQIQIPRNCTVDILIVGGGSGGKILGSGNGAGGVVYQKNVNLNAGTYSIVVGAGGDSYIQLSSTDLSLNGITYRGYGGNGIFSITQKSSIIIDNSYPIIKDASNNTIHPLAWYKFDVSDNLGLDTIGTYTATQTNCSVNTIRAKGSYSLDFNNSGYLTVSNSLFNNLASYTISVWVYLKTLGSYIITSKQWNDNNTYAVLSIGCYAATGGVFTSGASGKIYWHSKNDQVIASSTSVLSTNTWYLITLTANNTQCKIYINGSLDSTTTADYIIPNKTDVTNSHIGRWYADDSLKGSYINGYIDDFRLYNLVLTAAQISELYYGRVNIINNISPTSSVSGGDWANNLTVSGAGGSGIVIIKFKTSDFVPSMADRYAFKSNPTVNPSDFMSPGSLIDDLRIYNTTLSTDQINTLYIGTPTGTSLPPPTVATEKTDCNGNDINITKDTLIAVPSADDMISDISDISIVINNRQNSQCRQTFKARNQIYELLFSEVIGTTRKAYCPVKLFDKYSNILNDFVNYAGFFSSRFAKNNCCNYNDDGTYGLDLTVPDCGNIVFKGSTPRPKGDYVYIKTPEPFALKRYAIRGISGFLNRAPKSWSLYVYNPITTNTAIFSFPPTTVEAGQQPIVLSYNNYCATNNNTFIVDMSYPKDVKNQEITVSSNEYLFVFHSILGGNPNDKFKILAFEELQLYKTAPEAM